MRKLLVLVFSVLAVMAVANLALATTTLQWTGQGSENLPCARGGHWVLTGKGVTSATMFVVNQNGTRQFQLSQSGNGSFSADSTGKIDTNTIAYVEYEGTTKNSQFVLSHCNAGGGVS